MGYYVRIDDASWIVTESAETLSALHEMVTKYHAIKRGGSSNGESWFSWMSDETILGCTTAQQVFTELGFETTAEGDSFAIHGYDNKTGQEDLFLAVVAPFTVNGSYMDWVGEDDNRYRFEVRDGRMYQAQATIKWSDAEPYRYLHYDVNYVDGVWDNKTVYVDPYAQEPCKGMENRRDVKMRAASKA